MSVGQRNTRRQRAAAGLRTTRARFRALDPRDRLSLWAWLFLTLALAPLVIGSTGRMHASEVVVPGTESAKAQALSEQAFGREYDHLVLLQGPRRTLDKEGPAIAERIARIPEHRVLDPWRAGGKALRPERDKAVLVVGIRKSFDDAGPAAGRLREQLRDEVKAPLTVHLTGFADLNRSIKDETVTAMEFCELLAAPLLVLILILVLGSPIAAAMPLALGGCVAVMQIAVVDLINRYVTDLEVTSIAVGMAMSLALGVDYALLLVARFRRELAAGTEVGEASEIAATNAGRTVKFAAAVLVFTMTAATIATPASVLKSATIGVLAAVAFSVLGATLALPPLLRWAGHDINRYQIVSPGAESRRWSGIALAVLRRPVIAAGLVLAMMLAISAPALGLETGPPDPRILPKDDPARADFDVIERELGATRSMPFVVTVVANSGTLADERLEKLARFERQLARDRETDQVLGPATVARRTAALAQAPGQLDEASAGVRDGRLATGKLENGLERAAGGADQLIAGLSTAADGSRKLEAGGASATDRREARPGRGVRAPRRAGARARGRACARAGWRASR
jgi:putative drug exporter of the RND superfamily